jgi:type I restriction enzyme S subunit
MKNPKKALPKDWKVVKLGDICELVNGNAYKDADWSNKGIPIIRIQNLNDVNKPFNYWEGPLEDKVQVNNGDLLLAWSGTPGTSFGAHIWSRGLAVLNQHIFKVIIDSKIVHVLWIMYAINHVLEKMIEKSHGAVGLRHITKGETENLEIILPSLCEQKRITQIIETKLNAVEKAKKAINDQLVVTKRLLDSFILIEYNEKKYKNVTLDEISLINPSTKGKMPDDNSMEVSFIPMNAVDANTGNIVSSEIKSLHAVRKGYTFFENNDILFAKITPCMQNGKHAIARDLRNGIGFGSTEFHVIKPSEYVLPEWIHYFIRQSKYLSNAENYMQGVAGQQRLPDYFLRNTIIPLPSLKEQKEIIFKLNYQNTKITALKKCLFDQLSYIDALSSSILYQAFRGEL